MIVDSISNGIARLEDEDGRLYTMPASWLPTGVKDGAVVRVAISRTPDASTVALSIDPAAEADQRSQVRSKLDRLRSKSTE